MNIFQTLQQTETVSGETEAERLATAADLAQRFAQRSGALQPTGDLLTIDQQSALDAVVADLAERGTTIRGYQHAAVETALWSRRVVLGFAPGLGKTLTTVTAWATEKALGTTGSLLVVCPPHLVMNWQGDVRKHHPNLSTIAVGGTKQADLPAGFDVVVVPDSIITARKDDMLNAIDAGTITAAAFDESHRFKNNRFQTKRANSALHISQRIHARNSSALVLSLTATLQANYPADVYQPFALCGPEVTKRVSGSGGWDPEIGAVGYSSFTTRWSTGEIRNGQIVNATGARDLTELNAELSASAYVWVDRYEVTDLPPVVWASQPADCSDTFQNVYEIRRDFLTWVEREMGKAAAERAGRAQQLTQLGYMRKAEALAKTAATADTVADLVAQGEQVVVFAHHREVVGALAGALAARKITYAEITGACSAKEKRANQHAFQAGDVQVVVCNIMSASTGIDLDSPTSRTVLFHQLPWTPADLVQAAGRVERLTQQRGCVAIAPLATDGGEVSFEERLWAILHAKVRAADAVNNGSQSDILANEVTIGSQDAVVSALMASYGWD